MADNSNSRKKALIISVLAFLAAGGGVFLFFVIQGSNDLTGANKKSNFTYGSAAREAASSFFKFVGFDDVETIAKEGPKERLRLKEYEAAGILDSSGAAASAGGAKEEDIPWAPSSRSASPSNIPRMAGGGGSGVGGLGGAGTRSSSDVSRFGGSADKGNAKVSASVQEGADGIKGKGSLASLAKSRALLGEGLRSGSAMSAKGKWDSSFGVGRGGGAGSGELAYGKTGLVNLDKIKKGEVDNLKTTDPKSLKVPEVGKPEFAGDGKSDKSEADAKKESDDLKKSLASSMLGAMGQGMSNGVKNATGSGGSSDDGPGALGGPSSNESGSCASGSSAGVCSAAAKAQIPSDTNVKYNKVGANANGDIYEVVYEGSGKGITPELKGTPVSYQDTAIVQMTKDGPKIISMGAVNETAGGVSATMAPKWVAP